MAKEDVDLSELGKGLGVVGILVILLVGVLLLLFFSPIAVVPAGNVGVVDTFGSVSEIPMSAGFNLKFPWQHVVSFSTKTIEIKENASTPSDEGLTIELEASILYHIDAKKAPDLYRTVGEDYNTVVIEPNFRSVIRGITSKYNASALYTSQREVVSEEIREALAPRLAERGIILESVLLRSITLPAEVRTSIESKLVAQQQAEQMEFVLDREHLEAERKIVEAGGIASAQEIINKSLTANYLTWYWISNLDKYEAVIYVPIGDNGMPIFKNVDEIPPLNETQMNATRVK